MKYLGIQTGKEARWDTAYPETKEVKYKVYAVDGKVIGIPVKSSWTIKEYLAKHG